MRSIFTITVIIFLSGLWACQSGKNSQKASDQESTTQKETSTQSSPADTRSSSQQPTHHPSPPTIPHPSDDSLWGYLAKTPCFGHCPIYKVWIYEGGEILFKGKKFMENTGLPATGWHQTSLTQKQQQTIKDSVLAIDYFSLEDTYDNSKVTDIPSTITGFYFNNHQKTIKNRYKGPDQLNRFETFFENQLQSLDWKKIESGNSDQ